MSPKTMGAHGGKSAPGMAKSGSTRYVPVILRRFAEGSPPAWSGT